MAKPFEELLLSFWRALGQVGPLPQVIQEVYGQREGHALRVQGRKLQMTGYFLSVSLYHSDIILMFQGPASRGNYWVLFYLSASVVSADLPHEGGGECQDLVCAREIIRKNEMF